MTDEARQIPMPPLNPEDRALLGELAGQVNLPWFLFDETQVFAARGDDALFLGYACEEAQIAYAVAAANAVPELLAKIETLENERRALAEELRAINTAAEADMLRGNPITGAHHRAIEKRLRELVRD